MKPPVNDFSIKDTLIRIFSLTMESTESGNVSIKKYHHPEGSTVHSYVRQLSSSETSYGNANQDGSAYLFVIYRRSVTSDMYIEVVTGPLSGRTFQIDGPDGFELRSNELRIYAHQTQPVTFTAIEYGGWLQ